jgi:hypothetical protein
MQLKFKHDDGVDTKDVWTDLSKHKDPLASIRMANASGWLYVKPRFEQNRLKIVGRFDDGKWQHTAENGGRHEGFNLENWIKYLYDYGHELG